MITPINNMIHSIVENYTSGQDFEELKKFFKYWGEKYLVNLKWYEFYGEIKNFTLKKWVTLLTDLLKMQLILSTPIYFPGVWLFTIDSNKKDNLKNYNFPEDFARTNIPKNTKDSIFCLWEILADDKLSIHNIMKTSFFWQWMYRWSLDRKIKIMNHYVIENYDLWKIIIKNTKPFYDITHDFSYLLSEYNNNASVNIHSYLKKFDYSDLIFNARLLEDIAMVIWYLENKKNAK